jgi:8-oxo-dGTP pyrophosphatase MutT (NUDIX family)
MTDAVQARDALALALYQAAGIPIAKTIDRRPLYVHRKLLNPKPLLSWARQNGIESPLAANDLHVTIVYSKEPVDWLAMGQAWSNRVEIEGGPRMLQRFGDALVLSFASYDLEDRHAQMRERGASFDFPQYRPHVTLSYKDPDVDAEELAPYAGKLIFGPEIFQPIEEDWSVGKAGVTLAKLKLAEAVAFARNGKLLAPHLGSGGEAAARFAAAPEQATFLKAITESELTGEPAFLGNPHGYVLHNPSVSTDLDELDNPEARLTFVSGEDPGSGLRGVSFEPRAGAGGAGSFEEPQFTEIPGKHRSAGVIIEEQDGRVWTINPLNAHKNYVETFPKGRVDGGASLRETAIREALEETGLQVELTGFAGDFERTESLTRYYFARRVGGDPTAFGWETQSVNLTPKEDLAEYVLHPADAPIISLLSGDNASVIKALTLVARMIEMGLDGAELDKAKGGSWKKQVRVPSGLPTGGQWTTYGSGKVGAAYAAGGEPLKLQIHGGSGPQSDQLNMQISAMEAAANLGAMTPYAQKLIAKEQPAQTYSSAAWASAKEAQSYLAAKAALPKPVAAEPAAEAPAAPGMMQLSTMTKVGPKPGGSSAGAVFQDASGTQWLIKSYDSELMARNEVASSKAYNALGVETPEMHLIDIGTEFKGSQSNGIAVASKMMDGLIPLNPSNPSHLAAAQKDFGAHVLLANWDAVGLGYDNLLLNPATGNMVMIDPGGSLLMRAMGKPKGAAFGNEATEIDTLRNAQMNPTSAKVFGPMTESQMIESVATAANAWSLASGPMLLGKSLGEDAGLSVAAKLDARAKGLLQKTAAMQANQASTTAMDTTKTGIVKPKDPEHINPTVAAAAKAPDSLIQDSIDQSKANVEAIKGDFKSNLFNGKQDGADEWYKKKVNELVSIAEKGDVNAVIEATYVPGKPSTTKKPNYQNYLKAHAEAVKLAEAVAAKNLKQGVGGTAEGSLLTGAAKISAAQLGAAKTATGDSPIDPPSVATAALLQPTVPKAPASQPLAVSAAVPPLPKLTSATNANLGLVAKAEQMKAIAEKGGDGAAAEIQAIALTIAGTNSFNKKAKAYAADLIATVGGQAAIDAMPTADKAIAFEAGLKAASVITTGAIKETIQDFGGFSLKTVTEQQFKTIGEQLNSPQSYTNWQGGGKGLSSKAEINKANEAIEQAIYAAAKGADVDQAAALAAVEAIDPGPSKHTNAYKAHILKTIKEGAHEITVVKSTEMITAAGGKFHPAEAAKAIANEVAIPQNFNALGHQKFYHHVLGAKVDSGVARALYDAIPDKVVSVSSKEVTALWDKSAILSSQHKAALQGHVGTNAATGKSWSTENNALRNGDVGTPAWAGAIKKAKLINEALTDIPEGMVVSRKISHGTAKEWAAKAGQVMNDPGINSTAVKGHGNHYPWSGGVQLRMKFAGASGAYVGGAKGRSGAIGLAGENELILPRNTKWLIVGERTAEMKVGDPFSLGNQTGTIIDVLVLPHDAPE